MRTHSLGRVALAFLLVAPVLGGGSAGCGSSTPGGGGGAGGTGGVKFTLPKCVSDLVGSCGTQGQCSVQLADSGRPEVYCYSSGAR
ncbi:MAG TPA: hypothetical protein VK524_07475, partial [Polyangiaceae bacterium]|nr:hypothetical protein [Polyangiaceae bacterium]